MDVLKNVEGLAFVHFDESDVVRHQLVQRIVHAYDEHKARSAEHQLSLLTDARHTNGIEEKPASAEAKG